MRALFITLIMAGTVVTGSHGQQSVPRPVIIDGITLRTTIDECNCGTTYRTQREWLLHRPSTPQERAETSRLNREFLAASRATPLPSPAPDAAQLAYQEQMKNYRALAASYERRMRDYARLHAQAAETRLQDTARAEP